MNSSHMKDLLSKLVYTPRSLDTARESMSERAERVERRRFAAEPVQITGFSGFDGLVQVRDPFRTDELLAEAMEKSL